MGIEEIEEVDEEKIVLVVVDDDRYQEMNRKMLHYLTEKKDHLGVYVTINKPCMEVKEFLDEDNVNMSNLFFVDAISKKTCGIEKDYDNVIFLDSPEDLTGLSIVISETLESMGDRKRFVFLDSISTLQVYNDEKTITKFSHYLTGKMRSWDNVSGFIVSLRGEADDKLISQLAQFCDKKIEL